jgi:hypothetical protein
VDRERKRRRFMGELLEVNYHGWKIYFLYRGSAGSSEFSSNTGVLASMSAGFEARTPSVTRLGEQLIAA